MKNLQPKCLKTNDSKILEKKYKNALRLLIQRVLRGNTMDDLIKVDNECQYLIITSFWDRATTFRSDW